MAQQRFWEIDFLRGVAVLMMVLFHFLWDLDYFQIINVDLYFGFWGLFQLATAGTFIFIVGAVLSINYAKKKDGYALDFFRRGMQVFLLGLVITAATLIFLPQELIFFGVLHLIGASIILSILFVRLKYLNLFLGALIVAAPLFYNLNSIAIPSLSFLGFASAGSTLDFFPLIPWFGVVLLGIFAGKTLYPDAKAAIELAAPKNKLLRLIESSGKLSLFIYFAHQFILFPLAYAISILL